MNTFCSLSKLLRRWRASRPPTSSRLFVEALEDRMCLSYSVIDLGTLGGAYSNAAAVNESGQVVGNSHTTGGTQDNQHAFLWQNGTMTDLGTLAGDVRSVAADINDVGQIVGTSVNSNISYHAVLWQNGIMTDLGTLGGGVSGATAINNHGQIVGSSRTTDGAYHVFVWEAGVMYDLNSFLPASSGWELIGATGYIDINDVGQIVGRGQINGQNHAFRLTDNDGIFANGGAAIIDLGTLGGPQAGAAGVNGSGQVVGWSNVADGSPHAFRYSGGALTDLKTLGGRGSYANAINDAGQIVGSSQYDRRNPDGPHHAFLWQDGKMNDLNKQLPRGSAWVLESAYDINGTGQIVGQGRIGGQGHAFLMVAGSLLQAESVSTVLVTEALNPGQVQPLLDEALARWQAAGVDTSALHGIDIGIADLGGTTLGLASGSTIWLDDNAAGWGWFVDATPRDDSEFTMPGDQGEQDRMDLLAVVMHELGHLLGHDHDEEGVMAETLAAGVRYGTSEDSDAESLQQAHDAFFACLNSEELPAIGQRCGRLR